MWVTDQMSNPFGKSCAAHFDVAKCKMSRAVKFSRIEMGSDEAKAPLGRVFAWRSSCYETSQGQESWKLSGSFSQMCKVIHQLMISCQIGALHQKAT